MAAPSEQRGAVAWSPQDRFAPQSDVVVERIDAEVVLLDLLRNAVFDLNEVGGFVWERLGEGCSVVRVVDAVCDAFEADRVQVEADVRELIDALLAAGLLKKV